MCSDQNFYPTSETGSVIDGERAALGRFRELTLPVTFPADILPASDWVGGCGKAEARRPGGE